MTDDERSPTWPPAIFAEQLQQAGEEALSSQQELFEQFLTGTAGSSASPFGPMNMGAATFKTRVQSGGRLSIPDAEREALDIEDGDIVQAIVVPVKRNRSDSNE
jgi:hypothetical protein